MSHPIHTADVLSVPPTLADGFLPEGPRELDWNGRPTLGWVNIQSAPDSTVGAIWLRVWETGETIARPLPGRPGFFLPTTIPDVVLLGLTKQVGLFDLNTSEWRPLAEIPDANPRTIINDAELTPDGRYIVFGTKDVSFKESIAHLYLFDAATKSIQVMADGQTCSNGKIIHAAPDGFTLYDIDTPTRQVRKYHLQVSPPRLTYLSSPLDLSAAVGFPDGMADAGDGAALIAFYNPDPVAFGMAVAFDLESGETLAEWRIPGSPRVTCPLLTTRNGRPQVVFTTALEGMPAEMREKSVNAGALFIAPSNFATFPKSVLLNIIG